VLDFGVLLLIHGDLIALAVDGQGGDDDNKHEGAADEQFDQGETSRSAKGVGSKSLCVHVLTC
jgi:hypothetical protein